MKKHLFLLGTFLLWSIIASAIQVTFQVDMSNQTVSGNGVHLAGGFGGNALPNWDPLQLQMSDPDLDNIYTITLNLSSSTAYQYKFVNGNAWGSDESVPGACQVGGNRGYTTGAIDVSIPVVCYGQCVACVPPFRAITFQVDMQTQTVSPNGVHLAGDFANNPAPNNGYPMWNPAGIVMTDSNADNVYDVTLMLAEGFTFSYKFINGNTWGTDEGVPGPCNVGGNRQMVVPSADATLNEVCFASCSDCVAAPNMVNVTFQVDMTNSTVGMNGVNLAGAFGPAGYAQWNPAGIAMTDNNTDNIYEVTLLLQEGSYYEYKFINGNSWGADEGVPSACNANGNRYYTVGSADVSLPVVCFASCSTCVAPPATVAVTFQVDLSQSGASVNGVNIAGSFGSAGYAEWSPNSIALTDGNNDQIYTVTLNLAQGVTYYYKVINGNDWPFAETGIGACGSDDGFGGFNRTVSSMVNVTLPAYCYGSCAACAAGPSNDSRAGAQVIFAGTPSACAPVTSTFVGASISNEAQSFCVTGQDLWYRFVAPEKGVRVQVSSTSSNVLIELQNAGGTMLDFENIQSGIGNEILNYGGLTPGQTYYVAVRNYDSSQGTGSFTICIQPLRAGGCDSGVGPYTLCNTYKARYGGSSATYRFDFTETSAPFETHTRTQASDILILSNVSGLEYGRSYNVVVTTIYTITNGTGGNDVLEIPGAPCSMSLVTSPSTDLRASDESSNGCRFRGSVVASLPWVCGASNWAWEFQELDNTLSPVGLPIQVLRGAANNLINLGSIPGLQYGKTYAVRTAPVFAYTSPSTAPGVFSAVSWGPSNTMCIVGSSVAAFANDENAMLNLDTRTMFSKESDIAIYPNPNAGNQFNLNMTDVNGEYVIVNVLDATGRLIESQRLMIDGSVNAAISLHNQLMNGLYFVELRFDNRQVTEKFIVEN